jgi:gamma-glutamylputrescine oxidase
MSAQVHPYAGTATHVGSYYAASVNPAPKRPELTGTQCIDVCVVGAGYTGLSTALHLAEKGHKAAIIEGALVGWGASGRNGGQIVNGLNASLGTIERRFGPHTAHAVGKMLQEGGQIIRDLIQRYDIKCDLKKGNLFAAYTSKQMRELEAKKELWRKHGMDDHEMVDKAGMHTHVQSDVYLGGMIDHSGGHMHPLNLALGEATAFESLGGAIYEHSPVVSVSQGASQSVNTARGEMRCKTLVLCGNAYLGHVVPELTWRIMPFSTQVMATEPLGDRAEQLLPTDLCVEDLRYILDYYRLSADKRLLFGGGTVYGGTDPANIEAKLRRNMEKVFPQLTGIKIDYAWSGNCALSFTRVPQMGKLSHNTYIAHG